MPDIDIDFVDRTKVLDFIQHRVAMRKQKENIVKHNTGVYFQEIPHDPFSNISTLDYDEAKQRGYFKLDFLNVSMYEGIKNEDHLIKLLNTKPDWSLLKHREIVDQLFHINGHYDIVNQLNPTSIEDLAAVLAVIRPGKRHLLKSGWEGINKHVWSRPGPNDPYHFKKSHAIAYAHAIVVQLNVLCEQAEQNVV